MPRASYDPAVKDAFIKAASDARLSKKTWGETHKAASEAGYQGSMQGIVKLLRAQSQRKGKIARKPGRPAGSKNARRVPTGSAALPVSSDLAGLINNLVTSRINEALDRAIGILQNAKA
jgi:hypothetical protein